MKYILIMLLVFTPFSVFAQCTNNNAFLEKYGVFVSKMKSISSFSTSNNLKGNVTFESLVPKSFVLKYQYEHGSFGFFLFILDLENEEIYFSQFSDGADIQKTMISGIYRKHGCVLDFNVSKNQKVVLNFNDNLNLTYLSRIEDSEVLEVITKFNFK